MSQGVPSGPRVSVVIPTHNRRALLTEAIDSALDQHSVSVEVVVVDDASSDGTSGWLESHPDQRVRHIRLESGCERTVARNTGLAAIDSPYVLFLDDDDQLAPGALHRLARSLERHRSSPVAAGTYATFGQLGPDDTPRRQSNGRLPIRRRMWREVLWGWYLLPGAGLWRTDDLRQLGGWDESRTFAEDLELSLRIHPRPMALVPQVVLRYRLHGRPISAEDLAAEEVMNANVRDEFLARLSAADRRAAQRVIEARPLHLDAFTAYAMGDYRRFIQKWFAGVRVAPILAVSPVLGPSFAAMLLKAAAAQALPGAWRDRIRHARRSDRARRFGSPTP